VSRLRHFWWALLVAVPVGLIALAWSGYTLTAITLTWEFNATLRLIAAGVIFYGMVLRWFMISERRLALAEAIEERRLRREAAETPEASPDGRLVVDEEQLEPELDALALQTRRLLRSVIGAGVLVLIWYYWSEALPIDGAVGGRVGSVARTTLVMAKVVLVIGISITVVRNLPGLLDLAGLRKSSLEPGTRYAVATIAQYLMITLAILVLARTLKIDWSQFGWIAAALSVGLGFGLQEIVANFVCGIILLFERPIRVGDVVTLGGVTGTVTRIRMRATTITNWDRQELVVPNKEFVTGSLINWTLSNRTTRLVIPVGVAYGSDTEKARQLLLEIAEQHPLVLDDPAPFTTFEAFGDSTLDLMLRCYLPDLDNRLKTITELNESIDRRFKEAGIEIAFPQRDIHIRSGAAGPVPGPAGGPV
jgi:potassium efflux system protein